MNKINQLEKDLLGKVCPVFPRNPRSEVYRIIAAYVVYRADQWCVMVHRKAPVNMIWRYLIPLSLAVRIVDKNEFQNLIITT